MTYRPIVFMFSGQGSQYYGMSKNLYQQHTVFREWMDRLDAIAKSVLGESIIQLMYARNKLSSDEFDQIIYNHPAIFMTELALAKVLEHEGINPDYLLGASMGEFVAAVVSGVFTTEDAMVTLVKQARMFEEYLRPGGMLAILAHLAH